MRLGCRGEVVTCRVLSVELSVSKVVTCVVLSVELSVSKPLKPAS